MEWGVDQQTAFQYLKDALIDTAVLRVADPMKPYILQTDASEEGLGAVLSQVDAQGEEHPVAFTSRKLLPWEMNYSTIEKECLAIVWVLKFFNTYLYGQTFTIETDHQPSSWLHRTKNSNARLTRWALAIQPYQFEIKHRQGQENGNADGLSHGALATDCCEMTAKSSDNTHDRHREGEGM